MRSFPYYLVGDGVVVLRHPYLIPGQFLHIQIVVEPAGAGIDHRGIALGLYIVAKSFYRRGSLGPVQLRGGCSSARVILGIDNQRQIEFAAGFLHLLDGEAAPPEAFFYRACLREVVGPYVTPAAVARCILFLKVLSAQRLPLEVPE